MSNPNEVKVTKKGNQARRYSKAGPLLTQARAWLRKYNLQPRKGLGQHFLIDEEVLKGIASAAELTPTDVVVEVGPGLGVLSRELARQAGWVVAVEVDNRLAALLKENLAAFDNITILNEDVLKINPAVILRGPEERLSSARDNTSRYKVVANLPYYITSPVLRHFLEASVRPVVMVVMVQKEVAEAIVAEPGRMSLLSVSVQLYAKPTKIGHVPANCFYPVPEVDSAILKICIYPQPAMEVTDTESFFELVRAGFSASRKQITNSLAQGLGLSKGDVLCLLEEAHITPQRRAETLTLEEWAHLWRVFNHIEWEK